MSELELVKKNWSKILKNFVPLDPEGEDYFKDSEPISLDEIESTMTLPSGNVREYMYQKLTIKIKHPEFVRPAEIKEFRLKLYIEEVTGIKVQQIRIICDLSEKSLEDFEEIKSYDELNSNMMSEFELIDSKWNQILAEVKELNFNSWLIFAASMPLSLNNNLLGVGFRYYNHLIAASKIENIEILQNAIQKVTSFNVLIEIQLITDDKFVSEFKKRKSKSPQEILSEQENVNFHINERSNSSNSKNTNLKMWQKILIAILLAYFLIWFLDSRFEFIPESNPGPQKIKEYECQIFTGPNGEYVDTCGDFVPEENPGYQGR